MTAKTVEQCWAIFNPRIGIYFHSVSDTRKCAIADHVSVMGDWAECRKAGDRAVKIKIEVQV